MSDEKALFPIEPDITSTQPVPQQNTHSMSTAPGNGHNPMQRKKTIKKRAEPASGSQPTLVYGPRRRPDGNGRSRNHGSIGTSTRGQRDNSGRLGISYTENTRANQSFDYRRFEAQAEKVTPPVAPDNGDNALYTDHSGLWSKALVHDNLELVNQTSWNSFINALTSTNFADFENIIVGNPGGTNFNAELNGPQTSLAFDLEGLDSHATVLAPAPTTASAQTADEEVEHYWAAMLRDVNFSDYAGNATAQAAAAELNGLTYIKSTANNEYPFPVTTANLFRGQIVPGDGNVQGPYLSQFILQPAFFGAQPINQMFKVFQPNQNFMTSVTEFMNVQNGHAPSGVLAFDPNVPAHSQWP